MRWVLVVAGCSLALFVAGCGGQCGSPTPSSLSPAESTLAFRTLIGCADSQTAELVYDGGDVDLEAGSLPDGFSVQVAKDLAKVGHFSIAVTFAPQAMGEVTGDILLSAPDARATIHVNGVGSEAVYQSDPNELDFGAVIIGTQKTLEMHVGPLCSGDGHLEVSSDDPALSIAPTSLDFPGSAGVIRVTFTPNARGAIEGPHVRINMCPTCNIITRVVKGVGAIEQFTVDPTPLDFGQHDSGTSTCQDEVVKNTGDVPISLESPTTDAAFRGAFTIDAGSFQSDLQPDESTTFRVCFQPGAAGEVCSGRVQLLTTTNSFGSLQVSGRS